MDSVALVFQVRAVDRSRVEPPAGTISPSQLSEVHTLLDHLLGRAAA